MNSLVWVLVGVLLFWLGATALKMRGLIPEAVRVSGPIVTIHTKRGKALLDRLARPKRAWRAWGNFGLGVTVVVMVGTFLVLVWQAVNVVQNPPPPSAVSQPRNVLVIPGVNDFLPLSVAPEIILGLLLGLVVHEGGHGLLCRVGDIDISSMGVVLFTLLPVGAFVEPDEESRKCANRGSQSRMFAAGVTNNFLLTVVAFALLFGPVVGSIGVASGAAVGGVLGGSAADDAGIVQGDRIVAVNGQPVESNAELGTVLADVPDREVQVTLAGDRTTTIERSLLVTAMAPASPLADTVGIQDTVAAVNGTPVYTEAGLESELADRPVATLELENGSTVTAPMGSLVRVSPGGGAAEVFPANEHVVITALDGQRVASSADLSAILDETSPGDEVRVTAYVNGSPETHTVTLGSVEGRENGFLGVGVFDGVSGMSVNGFGTRLYPAGQFLDVLGGSGGGPVVNFVQRVFVSLLLPFASLALPELGFNFAGFVGWNANFYEVTGPLAALGGGTFFLANVLFWTGWINLNLGFFNCIPAFPLDGGHILRMGVEAVVARLPVENGRDVTRSVTTSVGLLMLVSLVLMLFGPQLLNWSRSTPTRS
ncbi:site-2 protease family protein [Halobacteriaceae archaeon GCM10025711]